jgi:hypothetical protein
MLDINVVGTLNVGYKVFSAAGVQLIPPFPGSPGAGRYIYKASEPGINLGEVVTHINTVGYTTLGTAHLIGIMRPFNWTYLTAAVAANGTAIFTKTDPGLYSTSYKYPVPGGIPVNGVADNAIAAGDYVAIQLVDGSFHVSTIASGTFGGANLVLTTALPNITGGGAAVGAIVYFFAVIGDANPATGMVNPQTTIAASQTRDVTWSQANAGICAALNPGDPMLFYTPNTTNNGTLEFISGFYAKGM